MGGRLLAAAAARAALPLVLLLPAAAVAQGPSPLQRAIPSAAEVQPRLRSGNWHLGVAIEVQPNVSGPATPPMEITRCLGPRQVDELMAPAPGAVCLPKVSRFTRDVIEWRHACRHNGAEAFAEGNLTFQDTRLEGTIVTTSPVSGLRLTTRIAGRYLGPCVESKAPAKPSPGTAPDASVQPPRPGERLRRYVEP